MRTFHLGGTATVVDQSFLEASYEGTVRIKNRNMLRNSDGNLIAMGRSMASRSWTRGTERSSQRVAYGSKIYVDDGDAVKRGQRLAEWDPYTRPMMTEIEGTVEFEDVVDGLSVTNPRTRQPASPSVRSSTGVRRRAAPISSRRS
jgi:DNA-directed RNA polymerase subunit beta'